MEIYVMQTVNVSKTPFCKNCLRLERYDRKDASGRCVPYCSLFNRHIELHDGNYLKCEECYQALYEHLVNQT